MCIYFNCLSYFVHLSLFHLQPFSEFFLILCGCCAGVNVRTVNCKVTWEGTYRFTYEVELGGGGICDSPGSAVVACQEPGSVYVDNQVFRMFFGKCPMVTTSSNQGL